MAGVAGDFEKKQESLVISYVHSIFKYAMPHSRPAACHVCMRVCTLAGELLAATSAPGPGSSHPHLRCGALPSDACAAVSDGVLGVRGVEGTDGTHAFRVFVL